MKILSASLILCLWFSCTSVLAQETPKMKTYTFVMLKKGFNTRMDSTELATIQKGHLEHLTQMAKDGDLNVAGPFLDDGFWRGLLIFNTEDMDKVKMLVEQDPAVKSGRLSYEVHPWMTQQGVTLK
jgi:uncharacterized protein